jgi:hypothetical protein
MVSVTAELGREKPPGSPSGRRRQTIGARFISRKPGISQDRRKAIAKIMKGPNQTPRRLQMQ